MPAAARRYASLYFCVGADPNDNELVTLEARGHYDTASLEVVLWPSASVCTPYDVTAATCAQIIQHFVEILDRYFGNVCELDLIFNFHKAYYILDEARINFALRAPKADRLCVSFTIACY